MKEHLLVPQGFSTELESSLLTREQIEEFRYLLFQAKNARAYPSQSGFFVKTAGITEDNYIWTGGNKEYGHSDAFIHGETAVASALKDVTGKRIKAIAWYRDKETGPEDFGRPCGNCRDVLNEYCDPDLVLLNGNEDSFVYTRFKDFLFEDFGRLNMDHVHTQEVEAGINAARGGNDVYLPEGKKKEIYGAVLVSKSGVMWPGRHYSNVGYDSTTPVLSAIQSWGNNYPTGVYSEKHLRLSRLVIVSEHRVPDVFYRDRQAILETDEILRRFTKDPLPMRVELIHARRNEHGDMVVYEARKTNTEEWLPHPFSPGVFRMDDVMEAQLAKLTGIRR